MNTNNFVKIRKDVLDNKDISLGAKGLYALVCNDLTTSLRILLENKDTKKDIIKYSKELMKYEYAFFHELENYVNNESKIGLTISIQPKIERNR